MTTLDGNQRPDLDSILGGLKDFQRKTVDYVFERLYLAEDQTQRFLIADEVGLGKTLVTRGVIARAIDHLWDTVDRIDVIYICSNQDIARQNIDRLNITSERQFQFAARATLLPVSLQELRGNKLNFVSLTPGTSFSMHSSAGVVKERALLYYLLREHWDLRDSELSNILKGDAKKSNWQRKYIKSIDPTNDIDRVIQKQFYQVLDTHPDLYVEYQALADKIGARRTRLDWDTRSIRNAWISRLRRLLAHSSLSALEPNIIILDEFQRFRYLLDTENEIYTLVEELFAYADAQTREGARTLLLSATPYKMYTLQEESGEDHYQDFLDTARFLLGDDMNQLGELKQAVNSYRDGLFRLVLDQNKEIYQAKAKIESILRKVMVRTERLAVSADRNGMVRDSSGQGADQITSNDLISFAHYDRIARALGAGDQVEYWKSAGYPINLMNDYKFKREFDKALQEHGVPGLSKMLADAREHLLNWDQIQSYQELDPGNARLRSLFRDTLDTGNWQLLWLPPAMPYYKTKSIHSGVADEGFTKTLVFSSWKLVPRAISALTSYEAERRMNGQETASEIPYDELMRRRGPRLVFQYTKGRLAGMSVLCLTYPCLTLATELDPLMLARKTGDGELPSSKKIVAEARKVVKKLLAVVKKDLNQSETGPADERWYWAGMALLDRYYHQDAVAAWLHSDDAKLDWSQMLSQGDEESGESRFAEHVDQFRDMFISPGTLGRMPEDLPEILAQVALASPAVTTLRAFTRVLGDAGIHGLAGAAKSALGFRTLFNTPDAISLLDRTYPASPYWQQVLQYSVDGNLQAVMDEYIHIMREFLGLGGHDADESAAKVADKIAAAVSLRSSPLRYDDIRIDRNGDVEMNKRTIRCRYAVRFGDEKTDYAGETHRADDVRLAFNSPFRPFLLATTSVGQEGLDFHQYCHRVVHWNLPPNPVDFEQREGRVHRYKGHAIRRNLSKVHGLKDLVLDDGQTDPWLQIFEQAVAARDESANDLVPFWVYETADGYAIERQIPMLPFSREVDFWERLKQSVVLYRSVIGQPRQQEMLDFLAQKMELSEFEQIVKKVVIDLSPPDGG